MSVPLHPAITSMPHTWTQLGRTLSEGTAGLIGTLCTIVAAGTAGLVGKLLHKVTYGTAGTTGTGVLLGTLVTSGTKNSYCKKSGFDCVH